MWGKVSYAVSVLTLVAGLAWAMSTAWEFRDGQRTSGTITKVDRDLGDGGPVFWPYFEFQDEQGAIHVRRFSVGVKSENAYKVGDRVDVLYPIGEPRKARVGDWVQIWLKPLIVVILGGTAFWVTRLSKAGLKAAEKSNKGHPPKFKKHRARR